MWVQALKRVLLGTPIPTSLAKHERLSRVTGLAVFASDALSSVAYATEEILLILVLAGTAALYLSVPIGLGIAALIAIVVSSYRQTILAYPQGGGAYIVTRENLGRYPSLIAGGALLIDYVLTVAVSIAAGIAAITSAVPALYPYRVWLCVLGVVLISIGNLRGVRESGKLFATPTYLFVGAYALMIGWGGVAWLTGGAGGPGAGPPGTGGPDAQQLTLFLALRAFASGCAALTGIEAVSDGVPAFQPPGGAECAGRARLARRHPDRALPRDHVPDPPLRDPPGRGRDRDLAAGPAGLRGQLLLLLRPGGDDPHPGPGRQHQLRRLPAAGLLHGPRPLHAAAVRQPRAIASPISNGILILAVLSACLLVIFQGDTHALIPLYAVGVFVSFTLSQSSMVRYWLRLRTPLLAHAGRAERGGRGGDRAGDARHRDDQVHPRGLDRHRS